MQKRSMLFLVGLAFLLSRPVLANTTSLKGVSDPQRAEFNWVMHCQGCHGVDARGSEGGAPAMPDVIARFLQLSAGRDFLGQVPGVAFVPLPTHEVAELLNWLLQTFDGDNLPESFQPYNRDEVMQLRNRPLVSGTAAQREMILRQIKINSGKRY